MRQRMLIAAAALGATLATPGCGKPTRCTSWTGLNDVAHWFDCLEEGDGPTEFRIVCTQGPQCLCESLAVHPDFAERQWTNDGTFIAPIPLPMEEVEWRELARSECGWVLRT